jgi:hypothetical protein
VQVGENSHQPVFFSPNKRQHMSSTNLHIVFGVQARAAIQYSKVYDANKSELACLQDNLAIGPISDLDTQRGKENRISWLARVYQPFPANEIANIAASDSELLDRLKDNINHYDQIYLWAGSDVNEILSVSRLLYFLQIPDYSRFLTIDFLNASVTRRIGSFVYPKSLNETSIDQVAELYTNFSLMKPQEFSKLQMLWEKLSKDHSCLRIAKEEAPVSGSEIDFYDANILVHCTKRYQAAVRIVGKALGHMNEKNIREGICDSFLNWRLKKLIEQDKLRYRGFMSSMRDYEVKLA